MYNFAAFDPRDTPEATDANQRILEQSRGGLFGIEVTVPALAALCTMGNLDPQHTEGCNVAACVEALTCRLPSHRPTLVTVRPDCDSLMAMAVLKIRSHGGDKHINRELVETIGRADSAQAGPWVRDYTPPTAFAQANAVAMNHQVPITSRVSTLVDWILGYTQLPPCERNDSQIDVVVSPCGRYATARANGLAGKGGCGAGYRHAPVVIVVNEAFSLRGETPHRKYTIARWNDTVPMDWDGMLIELRQLEPGWGGSTSICGSTQGEASPLTLEQVKAVVERHLPA